MRLNVYHEAWKNLAPDLDEPKRRELIQKTLERLASQGVLVRTRYSETVGHDAPVVSATKHERQLLERIVKELAEAPSPTPKSPPKPNAKPK